MSKETTITEETPVRLRLRTAWAIIVSLIATTVWLTAILIRIQNENQAEHSKLMMSLTEINIKSSQWVTKEQLEEALVYSLRDFPGTAPFDLVQEYRLREGVRMRLRTPKDSP